MQNVITNKEHTPQESPSLKPVRIEEKHKTGNDEEKKKKQKTSCLVISHYKTEISDFVNEIRSAS